ncbi:hypothetical protein ACF09G_11555 [Streptomyces albogriseolus]|uniref:hypothetical protein n=1 Tax=Streptomyces TaxID=1883 RepID=UPI001E47E943|nr:hypothetical protein [Streptomyces sp. DH20]MCP9990301.1 hypothetical protein [Streptomyces albogriseolus]
MLPSPWSSPLRLGRKGLAAERLHAGGDVSCGRYLERPSYLALAVVTCSPNRTVP